MSRFLDTALHQHHRIRIEAPQPYSAPHTVVVRWKPTIASVRGPEARYKGIILVVSDAKAETHRLYDRNGLVALLFDSEIESMEA